METRHRRPSAIEKPVIVLGDLVTEQIEVGRRVWRE